MTTNQSDIARSSSSRSRPQTSSAYGDVAECEDAQSLAFEVDLTPGVVKGPPLPSLLLVDHLMELLPECDYEAKHVGGHGADVGLAGVRDRDVACDCLRYSKDPVDACTWTVNPLEIGSRQVDVTTRPTAVDLGLRRGSHLLLFGLAPGKIDVRERRLQVPDDEVVGLAWPNACRHRRNEDFHPRFLCEVSRFFNGSSSRQPLCCGMIPPSISGGMCSHRAS